MKITLQNNNYDTMLEASDWRFSAAIVGLMQYLDYHDLNYKIEEDSIYYNSEDINEEKYLEFVEYKYGEELHHKVIENIISNDEISEEQVKIVNEKLSANTIMKKKFNKIKFDGTNREEILSVINENRNEIIRETFRSKSNMYANYANTNQLFNDSQDYCRLLGYCIDVGKKGKSTGFNFSTSNFVGQDERELDFIPFAFEGNREAFFINDNYTIKRLKISNETLRRKIKSDIDESNKGKDIRKIFFKGIIESTDFIDRDVEVIFKDRDKGYFETLYIRKESVDILKKFKDEKIEYSAFCFFHKVTENYRINVQKKVIEAILNNLLLDEVI